MSDFNLIAAQERVRSEISGALLSIHSYKSVEPNYFAMMKAAIAEAARLFEEDGVVPPSFLHELEIAAQILRNEATAFEGRTAACLGMAEWLDATLRKITSLTRSAAAEE
jgi:hypothetical protein